MLCVPMQMVALTVFVRSPHLWSGWLGLDFMGRNGYRIMIEDERISDLDFRRFFT